MRSAPSAYFNVCCRHRSVRVAVPTAILRARRCQRRPQIPVTRSARLFLQMRARDALLHRSTGGYAESKSNQGRTTAWHNKIFATSCTCSIRMIFRTQCAHTNTLTPPSFSGEDNDSSEFLVLTRAEKRCDVPYVSRILILLYFILPITKICKFLNFRT